MIQLVSDAMNEVEDIINVEELLALAKTLGRAIDISRHIVAVV